MPGVVFLWRDTVPEAIGLFEREVNSDDCWEFCFGDNRMKRRDPTILMSMVLGGASFCSWAFGVVSVCGAIWGGGCRGRRGAGSGRWRRCRRMIQRSGSGEHNTHGDVDQQCRGAAADGIGDRGCSAGAGGDARRSCGVWRQGIESATGTDVKRAINGDARAAGDRAAARKSRIGGFWIAGIGRSGEFRRR